MYRGTIQYQTMIIEKMKRWKKWFLKQFEKYLSVFQRHDLGELCGTDDGVVWDDLPGRRTCWRTWRQSLGVSAKYCQGSQVCPKSVDRSSAPYPRAGGVSHLDEDIGHVEFLKWNKNKNDICLQALSSLFLETSFVYKHFQAYF